MIAAPFVCAAFQLTTTEPLIGPLPVSAGGVKLTFAVADALAPAFSFVGAPGGTGGGGAAATGW